MEEPLIQAFRVECSFYSDEFANEFGKLDEQLQDSGDSDEIRYRVRQKYAGFTLAHLVSQVINEGSEEIWRFVKQVVEDSKSITKQASK